MKFRLKTLLGLAAVGMAFSAAAAPAAIIVGLNQENYLNREQLATYNSATNTYTARTDGSIGIGDHLYGISAATNETGQVNPTVTTVFDIVVAQVIDTTAGSPTFGMALTPAQLASFTGDAEVLFTSGNATLSSGQTGGFLTGSTSNTYTLVDAHGNSSTINGMGQAANTLDAVYNFGSTLSGHSGLLDSFSSQANAITAASNGVLFGDFGLGQALTDTNAQSLAGTNGVGYWSSDLSFFNGQVVSSTVPFTFGLVSLTAPPDSAYTGLYNPDVAASFGTSREFHGTDGTNIYANAAGLTPLSPNPLAGPGPFPNTNTQTFTYVGGGHANANTNAGTSVWATSSTDPTYIDPITPEPGTMLMIGMGLALGLPYVRRRKNAA